MNDAPPRQAGRTCEGIFPLTARLEPWQRGLCDRPAVVRDLLSAHGSPVNVLSVAPLWRNANELRDAAEAAGVSLRLYFARKANKAVCFVDEARRRGLGVDVASERELGQTLSRGVPPEDVIVTAAVKPRGLLALGARHGVTVAVDNIDELRLLRAVAADGGRKVPVALRIAPAITGQTSRFGFPVRDVPAVLDGFDPEGPLDLKGIHFHVDGYGAAERITGIDQSLQLVRVARERGHRPEFIDIGGGIPMRYLDDARQWSAFWDAHRAALRGGGAPVTFDGHGLGLVHAGDDIVGRPNVYPSAPSRIRGEWLSEVLAGTLSTGRTVAAALCDAQLRLHCEPGRSLLDGCGVTFARVEFRKRDSQGRWFIGLAMNRTQCRSTADEFMVDPILVPAPDAEDARTRADEGPIDGYLVGSYCIERELLMWRRLHFPSGVRVGDAVAFPNTAGYLMHILESTSHQIPLARNIVAHDGGVFSIDPIDAGG